MKVSKDNNEQLVVESKPGLLGWFLLVWAFAMLFFLIKSYFEIPRNIKDIFGAGTGGLFVFLAYMVFYEKTVFNFNKISKQLIWKRRRFLKNTGGIISFHNINNVILQNSSATGSASNVRVALITDTEQIPLTTAYLGNDNLCIKIAKKVRQAIKHPDKDLLMDSVKEMIKNGHEIEAIKLLRTENDLSLSEAKKQVENIRNQTIM